MKKLSALPPGLVAVPVPLVKSAYPVAFGPGSSPSWSVCSWLENSALAASDCFEESEAHLEEPMH